MALLEHNTTLDTLISYTTSGLEISSYTEVRNALIARYQEIYGDDIDISDDVADGVWINTLANLIESILRICRSTYEMLNVDTATGIYLDNLCSLTNIFRKSATASSVGLYVTNIGSSDITLQDTSTSSIVTFIDSSSVEWTADSITVASGETVAITATCSQTGKYYCVAGSITSTLINFSYITIEQPNDAVLGTDAETDDQLRLRRGVDTSTRGTTVLQTLHAALYQLPGMQDVKIYNNNSSSSIYSNDGTEILQHNQYIICRYVNGITIDDKTIAKTIFFKLTPGISTTESNTNYGHSYDYEYNGTITNATNTIYWCVPDDIDETVTIYITANSYFAETTCDLIAESVMETANNLFIGENLTESLITAAILDADPLFKSRRTFTISSITLTDTTTHDAYYQLSYSKYVTDDYKTYVIIVSNTELDSTDDE